MNRVFQTSEIETMCQDLKTILEQCKEHVSAMKSCADKVESALNSVPRDVQYGDAFTALYSLRQSLKTDRMDEALQKLEECRARACELIPAADEEYAAQTRELTSATAQITGLLEGIRDFLAGTPLTTDDAAFQSALGEVRAKWEKVTEDAQAAVEKLLASVKGAETVCQVFSKDPVNLSTGNFIYDRTDLEVPEREPFGFRRFYNAINGRKGAMGKDWNHNYEVCVRLDGGEAVLLKEDGKEERFFQKEGKYLPLFASEGTFTETGDGYEYLTRGQRQYRFDRDGRCLEIRELSGSRIRFSYEEGEGGRLKRVEKDTGEWLAFACHEEGLLASVEDHTGRRVSYVYRDGLLREARLPDGGVFRYCYTPGGKLESVENPLGTVTVENRFDEEGRTLQQEFPDGTRMTYAYDDRKKSVELTERNGSKVTYLHDDRYRDIRHIYSNGEERFAYNQNNQRTLYVDRLGNRTQYAYDPAGNLTRVIDALGNRTEIRYGEKNRPAEVRVNGKEKLKGTYDGEGRLLSMKDALGNQTEITYNSAGWPERIVQPDGSEVGLAYDSRGNITGLRDASGSLTRYTYDSLNRVTESVDGNRTRYAYDVMGNVTEIENAEGNRRYYEYNLSGKVTKVTDFDGHSIRREYNALNRPGRVTDKEGRETLLTYDSMWNLARVTTPDGARTTYIYNEHNLLTRIKDADGGVVRYTYDANGNRTGEEDENGAKTTFAYDALGRVTEVKGEEGLHYTYAYDGKGQLLSKLDKEGFLTKYAYTKQGDLSRIQYADGREVKLSYNPLRQLILVQDWLGETKITPDALGRATAVQYPDGREVSYTYGKSGERTGITYPDGRTVSYGYDEQARLSEMREGDRAITYGYDAFGRLAQKKFPNGTESAYTYDSKGQLTELVHRDREGVSDRYTYLYDLTGNKTGITKERRGLEAESGAYAYGYDALGRLSQIQKDGKLQTRYGYDAFGNRVLKEDRAGRTTYRHNALNQLITELREGTDPVNKSFAYDKRGNLTRITENGQMAQRYVYGALNRLEEAVNGAGKAAKYQYNGLGHRVGKAEGRLPADQSGKLDPQSRIDREIGNLTQIHYTIDLTREYHNLLEKTEGEKRQTYFWDGNVVSYEENGRQSYYLQDELGSPIRIEDETGAVRESYGYGAFGEDLYGNQGTMQPFGYTGYQKDKVAGTYFAQAREYQVDAGRFVGRDIIKGQASYPLTINEYIYCGNMPFYFYDPNGLFWHIVAGAVVGAVANTVINVGTSLLKGEKITADLVASSLVGGAVTGGVTAATGNVTLGSVAGGAAETITKGAIDGDSIQNIVQDVAVGAVADVAFSKAGKFLKNTSKVKQVTDFAKGTKLGNKIFTHTADYKSEIKRLRGIWKKTGKAVKPKFKTYVDGFVGTTGTELIDKVADMNGSLTPGMDLKKELKNILNSLYDKGEEWVEENRKMQQYTQQALTQILKNLTNEEVATVMCIE